MLVRDRYLTSRGPFYRPLNYRLLNYISQKIGFFFGWHYVKQWSCIKLLIIISLTMIQLREHHSQTNNVQYPVHTSRKYPASSEQKWVMVDQINFQVTLGHRRHIHSQHSQWATTVAKVTRPSTRFIKQMQTVSWICQVQFRTICTTCSHSDGAETWTDLFPPSLSVPSSFQECAGATCTGC